MEREERKEGRREGKRRDSPVFLITEGGHCLWDSIHLLHSAESHFHSDSLFTFKTLFISLSPRLIPLLHCSTRWVMFHWYHVATKSSLLCSAAQHKSRGEWGRAAPLPVTRFYWTEEDFCRQIHLEALSVPCRTALYHLHTRAIKRQGENTERDVTQTSQDDEELCILLNPV